MQNVSFLTPAQKCHLTVPFQDLGYKSLFKKKLFPKLFCTFIRPLECKWMARSHFAGGGLEQGDMLKGSIQRKLYGE